MAAYHPNRRQGSYHPAETTSSTSRDSPLTSFGARTEFEWYGHLPCADEAHRGCIRHSSIVMPLFYNKDLLSTLPDTFLGRCRRRLIFSRAFVRGIEAPFPEIIIPYERLKPISSSLETLKPLCHLIQYNLAYYHLYWAKNHGNLTLGTRDTTLITSLSCADRGTDPRGLLYDWTSNIIYHQGIFLQQQQILLVTDKTLSQSKTLLYPCPHLDVWFHSPIFSLKAGSLHARLVIIRSPLYTPSGKLEKVWCTFTRSWREFWDSTKGSHWELFSCPFCYTDTWLHIELSQGKLRIFIACYRDLGPVAGSPGPKWTAHLCTSLPVRCRPSDKQLSVDHHSDVRNMGMPSRVFDALDIIEGQDSPPLYVADAATSPSCSRCNHQML